VPLMMLPGTGRSRCSLPARHKPVSNPAVRTDAVAIHAANVAVELSDAGQPPSSAGPLPVTCSSSPAYGHDPNCRTSQNDPAVRGGADG
jgi:hypothetical protein